MIALLATIGTLSAQDFDQRLLAGFTIEELENMQQNDPSELKLMEIFVERGTVFMDFPKGKDNPLDPNTAIVVEDENNFNPLSFNLKPHKEARLYFPLEGKNRMVMVLPRTELTQLINENK